MAGTLTITGQSSGLASGTKTIGPATMTGTSPIGEILDLSLVSGDNTVSIPTGAVAFMMSAISAPSATIKYRTSLDSGDAGVGIAPSSANGWALALPIPTGATSLIFNASASASGIELSFT